VILSKENKHFGLNTSRHGLNCFQHFSCSGNWFLNYLHVLSLKLMNCICRNNGLFCIRMKFVCMEQNIAIRITLVQLPNKSAAYRRFFSEMDFIILCFFTYKECYSFLLKISKYNYYQFMSFRLH